MRNQIAANGAEIRRRELRKPNGQYVYSVIAHEDRDGFRWYNTLPFASNNAELKADIREARAAQARENVELSQRRQHVSAARRGDPK